MESHEDNFYLNPDLRDAFDLASGIFFNEPVVCGCYDLETVGNNPLGFTRVIAQGSALSELQFVYRYDMFSSGRVITHY